MRTRSRLDEQTVASVSRPSSSANSSLHSASLTRPPDTPTISSGGMTQHTTSSFRCPSSDDGGSAMWTRRRSFSSGFHAARRNEDSRRPIIISIALLFLVLAVSNIFAQHSSAAATAEDTPTARFRGSLLQKSVPSPRRKRQTTDIGGTAFDLLKLENRLLADDDDDADGGAGAVAATPARATLSNNGGGSGSGGSRRRDDALSDEKCQKRCNERLRGGLDMVKAHSAFGSIGVPSVIDRLDLQMFCRLDAAHDRCLRDCGFEIHFNMRDYVCRERYAEMVSNLACYERSAAQLKRRCGAQQCGPYAELDVSVVGFAARCRTLLCDLNCTESVLAAQCGTDAGSRAARFLLDYTRVQISTWMRDMSRQIAAPVAQFIPPSCARLFCERFDATNCTSIVTSAPLPTSLSFAAPTAPARSAWRLSATSRASASPAFMRVNSASSASSSTLTTPISELPPIVRPLPPHSAPSGGGNATILDGTAMSSSAVSAFSATHAFPAVPSGGGTRLRQSAQGFA